jgi:DNA-binding response OmpR family regulator
VERVLVIESSAALREELRTMLTALHLPAQITSSAATGLAIATWFRPTVILFGLAAPSMEPSMFATLMREQRPERVSFVAVTASTAEVPAGFDARLALPLDADALARVIGVEAS